jgi:hypothetical protein
VAKLKRENIVKEVKLRSWNRVFPALNWESFSSSMELLSPRAFYNAYTFQWLQWGQCNQNGIHLLKKMISQQTNIAILSALLLTVWFPLVYGMEVPEEGEDIDKWIQTAITISAMAAITFNFLAMVNSTIILMLYGELSGDADALRFSRRLGINLLAPMMEFYIGCVSGICATLLVLYRQHHFVAFITGLGFVVVFGFWLNGLYYHYNLRSLEETLRVQPSQVALDLETINDCWEHYLSDDCGSSIESASPDGFKIFCLSRYWDNKDDIDPTDRVYELTYVTVCRIDIFIQEKIDLYLQEN